MALEGSVVILNDYFFEKVAKQEVEKRQLPQETANAVKHAYAASLVYKRFRTIYLSKNLAKKITIFLGKTNEVAEIIFKTNRDSTLEMMKDLQNNLLGILALDWLESHQGTTLIEFIGELAEKNILVLKAEDVVLPENEKKSARISNDYSTAVRWFESQLNSGSINIESKI